MKNNKNSWIIIAGFVLIQLILFLILSKAITAKTNLLVTQKHKLTAFTQKDSSLIQLEKDYSSLEGDIGIIDEALPNKETIVDFIGQLEKQASASGVSTKIVFSNQSIKSETGGVKSISFNLNLTGTYFAMVKFIQGVEKMPQVINVERISIQSPEGIEMENNAVLNMKVFIDPNF